ncbi:MAG: hypothetical protein ACE5LF_08405, partial [Alphaproteobacteria bacterium]
AEAPAMLAASPSLRDATVALPGSTRKGRVIKALGRRPPPLAMLQHRGAAPSWPTTSMTRCSP